MAKPPPEREGQIGEAMETMETQKLTDVSFDQSGTEEFDELSCF